MTQQTTELNLNPGSSVFTVVRFTAPSAGVWLINGFFRAIDTQMSGTAPFLGSDVHVVVNGTTVFSAGDFTPFLQQPINLSETLNLGGTVDFVVGNGGFPASVAVLNNGLTVQIVAAPEPSSMILIGIGSAILVAVRKRRARA